MTRLLVASRKGLFVIALQSGGWKLLEHHFPGEPVTQVLADVRDGAWYAALRMGHFGVKLRRSLDQGASWTETGAPAFPAKPEQGPGADDATPWSVDLIWALCAGGVDQPGTLWAGCMPAGLFRSDDAGATWSLNRPLWDDPRRRDWFGGGYDHAGIHSVLVDPRDSAHLTLAVSCGGAWQSRDSGAAWELTASGMSADYMPPERAQDGNIQDPHCLVQCAANPDVLWIQHHSGIFRSVDAGLNWQATAKPQPSAFGFAVACDPTNPRRAWFVPAQADGCRIPVDGRMVVTRTDDGGASFTTFATGLPPVHAYHLVYRHAVDVSADGRTLAIGSTTGGLWLSVDAGESWNCLSRDLPPVAALRLLA